METNQFIIEQISPYNMDRTVEMITKKAKELNWSVPFVHDLQQSLAKSGKEVKPVKVIEICKPEYSGRMLELNDERIISVMMPCRISVYMKNDGKTYVALINVATLMDKMPGSIALIMKAASDESYKIVSSVINKTK
jgi:uncharacterized protein (DUF302 family)